MSKHAFLSPSGSHRWLNCTPSAMLESEFPGGSSSAAEEGTADCRIRICDTSLAITISLT